VIRCDDGHAQGRSQVDAEQRVARTTRASDGAAVGSTRVASQPLVRVREAVAAPRAGRSSQRAPDLRCAADRRRRLIHRRLFAGRRLVGGRAGSGGAGGGPDQECSKKCGGGVAAHALSPIGTRTATSSLVRVILGLTIEQPGQAPLPLAISSITPPWSCCSAAVRPGARAVGLLLRCRFDQTLVRESDGESCEQPLTCISFARSEPTTRTAADVLGDRALSKVAPAHRDRALTSHIISPGAGTQARRRMS
jgi:hypothetical protein